MTIFTSPTDLFHIVTVEVNEKHVFITKFSVKSNRNIAQGGERKGITEGLLLGNKPEAAAFSDASAAHSVPREANHVSTANRNHEETATSPIGHAI